MSSQRKLLLADDSITIQKVVNLTFADEGIEVITVGDGDSAMEKMAESAPDLVLADVNMPGLNGYELCEKIRQSDKKTPVILLVGSFEPFDEEKARSVGADDFLTKPFQSIRQLVSKVTDLLKSPQNGESSADDSENVYTSKNFSVSEEYTSETEIHSQFGDAGMDDEMIQTDQSEGYSMDESSKFESKVVSEPEYEGKTQPLTTEDLRELPFTRFPEEDVSTNEPAQETADEEGTNEQDTAVAETETGSGESDGSKVLSSLFDFSDDDFLEIPLTEEDEAEENESAEASTEYEPEMQSPPPEEENQYETVSEESGDNAVAPAAYQQTESETAKTESAFAETGLSPEMIDAIAQRVVEKLSEKAVKDVAWEVVPQMADLIIKKMAEEKLKE